MIAISWGRSRFAVGIVSMAMAAVPSVGAAWSGYINVTILNVTTYQAPASVGVLVKFSPATPNLEGCSYTAGDYAWIDTTQADGKAVHASLLGAHLAGRTVDIGVHGCTAEGRPRIYGVTVR